ncbi:pyridoxamine 5'-phosphate oxidase family protein [Leucobacter viscericola]|uniref:Pyridoxamine 5'-phosphate oxidase family protein n=1 Tax=Leucobacter viscericola TaxID=2714935 RepID=A0A6G7XHS9_9MICO|nr:pyridoxamine 5'-phosphate oxidase family protein [Leucobacter viscericola]QIK64103.1 pyridoxamine 5'-phosphate oxidase family protein [Leucobacter viscericola]
MNPSSGPITVLSDTECWEHLATQRVGRLVTSVGDVVDIVPINFVVDGDTVVFRTAPGSKLSELTVNSSVVFEVDSFGETSGWSVVLRGRARALETEAEIAAAELLPLKPFVPTVKRVFVRIEATAVTGRSFVFGSEPDHDAVHNE